MVGPCPPRHHVSLLILLHVVVASHCQFINGGFTVNRDQYTLRWEVFGEFVTFRAIARGTGYVGFGISPKGTMEGSDLFISGMHHNGSIYGIDAHGAGEKDAVSNYALLFLRQSHMYTEVHFRRAIQTGDCKEDLPIMNEAQYVIWSIGPPSDALEHHGPENRGSVFVNLLNPPMFHTHYRTNGTMHPPCMDMGIPMNTPMDTPMDTPMGTNDVKPTADMPEKEVTEEAT